MEKKRELGLLDKDDIVAVGKALSNPMRIEILKLLSAQSMNVKELSQKLGVPLTSCASNIDILEAGGLITTSFQSGQRGLIKLCSIKDEELHIGFMLKHQISHEETESYSVPIGSYSSFSANPTCGLADENGFLGRDDDSTTFYVANRFKAQLIWMSSGFLEYTIPLKNIKNILALRFKFEICSEAPGYRNDFPSDITFSINGVNFLTWTCPGDFGGRRGKFTPQWWEEDSTQYGLLTQLKIDNQGSFLNHVQASFVRLKDLNLGDNPFIRFRIEVKKDAKNVGGFNLFGEKFGDYPNNIEIEATY